LDTILPTPLSMAPVTARECISEENFDEIVCQYQRRVFRVIFLFLHDADAVDTLTQECFLRVYQTRAAFRGKCRMETWILRIALNLARDYHKNRRVRFWKGLVGLEDHAGSTAIAERRPSTQPTPEKTLLVRAELEAVWDVVASLSPQQRAIFLLRFVEEMSLAEVADVLSLRVGSVKTQLFRALEKVRRRMKEEKWH
jgi:RNA polymerase sigma-70 factor, ECF subfamily